MFRSLYSVYCLCVYVAVLLPPGVNPIAAKYITYQINFNIFFLQYTIIIFRHQLDLERPVSASSISLLKGLPSRLHPFGLQFSISFFILLLFILAVYRSQSDLFLINWFYFQFLENFFNHFVVKKVFQKRFISNNVNRLLMLFLRVQISLPYKITGEPVHYIRLF